MKNLQWFGKEYTYEELLEENIRIYKEDIERFRRWGDDEAVFLFQGKLESMKKALEWYLFSKGVTICDTCKVELTQLEIRAGIRKCAPCIIKEGN